MEQLEQYFLANEVENVVKHRVILLSVCRSKTYALARDLLKPVRPAETTFKKFVDTLKKHFSPKQSEIVERYTFYSRNRNADEWVAAYFAELHKLTEHCNFGETLPADIICIAQVTLKMIYNALLVQCIDEHKGSVIGKHIRDQHGRDPSDVSRSFKILGKCQSKFDYLIYEIKKNPITHQQCVVYHFKCDLRDADYVGYTCQHLYQCMDEHKGSVIGKHVRDQHGRDPSDVSRIFKILPKCQSKFDCLIYEMLFIKDLKPTLNTQSDSTRAKLFV